MSLRHALTAALVVCAVAVLSGTTADPDLWGHVRFGQDILASRSLHAQDVYSFTSDRPWINHEWLSEVLMALTFDAGGALGLNLLRLTIIALVLMLAWRRLWNLEPVLRVQLVVITALGIVLRVHPVRPQLFSVLLFAVLLMCLTRADARNSVRPLYAVPLLLLAWVNLHGGWIVGVGVLGYWIASRLITRTTPGGRPVLVAGVGVSAVLVTLLNPHGADMWRFLADTVSVERPLIGDWQPMYMLPPAFALVWVLPAALAGVVFARSTAPIDRTYAGLVVLLGIAAVRVSRLDAFFTLSVVFCLAPLVQSRPRSGRVPRALVALAAAASVGVMAFRLPFVQINPSLCPEAAAAQYIREHRIEGRMLTWFDWGQYAIWHLGPSVRVSMDGRRETVYSDAVVSAHLQFYAGARGAAEYPDRIGADYVWLPKKLRAVTLLRGHGWQPLFEGPVSIILARSPRTAAVQSATSNHQRFFPGL
jgi:hypothetical protein